MELKEVYMMAYVLDLVVHYRNNPENILKSRLKSSWALLTINISQFLSNK